MLKTFPLILSATLLIGCSHEPREASPDVKTAPVPVQTVEIAPATWPAVYEAPGTVRARTAAVLSSKVMGYVREVRVHTGDRVREGQTLVVLDARDLDASYRQAEAARNEARSALPEAENAISSAKANLDLAKATFARMKDLFDKRSISNQEFDEASAKLKVAQAGYEMAVARRSQLESRIAQAEQGFESAKVAQSYGQIAAPFAGTVTDKTVEPGNLAAPGTPLLTIEREGAYRFEVAVEESKLALVHSGQQVTVSLDAVDRPVQGRVSEIVPAVDSSARAFTVKIDLPAMAQLRSGLFGRARFEFGTRSVLAVPAPAVSERGQLTSVFVAENGKAKMRLVTIGERSRDRLEILSGLNAGERIIEPVPPGLADGAAVEVRP
jgi:RND family efflux transporter MFP subunit